MKKAKRYDSCTKMRRMFIQNFTLSMATGERTLVGEEWVTRECGVPLFGDDETKTGICRSCANGWTHPNNHPVQELVSGSPEDFAANQSSEPGK